MMDFRQFGKTDMKVSVLGFGGAEIGFQETSLSDVEHLLSEALDSGLNVVDTAACYNISEESIGKAISHRRSDYYLFTKCGHAAGLDLPNWSPELVEKSIDRSLDRLHTDYLDVVHLHGCSKEVLEEGAVVEALQRAKQSGKTRYIGYSGDREDALYAIELGVFDSLETSISIADQEAIEKTLPEALKRNMGIIAKRPLANVSFLSDSEPTNAYIRPYWERLRKLDYDFLHQDIATSVSTALRFTLTVPGVHTAIVGTTKPKRYRENMALLKNGLLSEEHFQAIRSRWHEVAGTHWVGQG